MSYFPDLSTYTYARSSPQAVPTRNVGWLDPSHDFPVAVPSAELLERLWQFCLISVWPTRGMLLCPFCKREDLRYSERDGAKLFLGTAEIRVFERTGEACFAAPNLIYHYVEVHHYLPPPQFLEALESGLQPATPEYREMLAKSELPWMVTPLQKGDLEIFRDVKRDGKVVREWVNKPKA
jgi:hypothetical protein